MFTIQFERCEERLLDARYLDTAKKAYNGLIDNFITVDSEGL